MGRCTQTFHWYCIYNILSTVIFYINTTNYNIVKVQQSRFKNILNVLKVRFSLLTQAVSQTLVTFVTV